MHKANLQKHALNASFFLGIPLLWLGIVSFDVAPGAPQDMEFLPVVIRPFSSVDFGVDNFRERIAPMDEDIIDDAQGDRGETSPLTGNTLSIQENQGSNGLDDNPGNVPDDNPGNVPDDNPGNVPDDFPGNVPDDNPGNVPDDIPGNVPDDFPGNVPDDIPGNVPDDFPGNVPDDNPGNVPDDNPGKGKGK